MQYISRYFKIKELVNPTLLTKVCEQTAWTLFDKTLLQLADKIRDIYGVITVNSLDIVDAGFRLPDSITGSAWSAHKMGKALDLHLQVIEKLNLPKEQKIERYDKIRKDLLINSVFNDLNFEDGISWLHIDTFNRQTRLFKP